MLAANINIYQKYIKDKQIYGIVFTSSIDMQLDQHLFKLIDIFQHKCKNSNKDQLQSSKIIKNNNQVPKVSDQQLNQFFKPSIPKLWDYGGMSTFSNDSKYFFLALYNTDKLQIVSLESRRGTITDCKLGGKLKEIAISINPLYCCTVTSEQCLFWNQDTKKVDKKIESQFEFICCSFKNNDKELITISCQEQENTIISCWCTKRLKVLWEWRCKHISRCAKCYVIENTQILIVDYQDGYEHYIQIWNILGQSLIRTLYQAIESFTILNNFGSKLVVDCEDEDDDDDNDQNEDERDHYQCISFFDVLTFKYQRFKTFIEQGKRIFVQQGALIIENRKQNSNQIELFINFK